jgi:general secretion pathway protein J
MNAPSLLRTPCASLPAARTPPRPAFSTSGSGFTLVEILLAMAILSLVLVAIYSTWTAILRASKTGTEAAAAVQRARMAGHIIEESLGSVVAFALNQRYYGFVAENGGDAYLSFVTRLSSPSFPRAGKFSGLDLRRVTFSVETGRDGNRDLVLRQAPLLMEMDEDEQNYPLILAKNVQDFKTEFWDQRLQDWTDEWRQTNLLPVMVKVTLKLANSRYASQVHDQVTRIVTLPSSGVPPGWQAIQPNAPPPTNAPPVGRGGAPNAPAVPLPALPAPTPVR